MKAFKSSFIALFGITTTLFTTSCGRQEFVVTQSVSNQTAPGFYGIPPKVDVILAQDNSGSAIAGKAIIQSAMNTLMQSLQSQGWDYRFSVIPLVPTASYGGISQIAASSYDSNWGSEWKEPFPGSEIQYADRVDPVRFRKSADFSGYVTETNLTAGAIENGFDSILQTLRTEQNSWGMVGSSAAKLVRNDALLVTLVLSTGDDTSGIRFHSEANPCNDGFYHRVGDKCQASVESSYQDRLAQLKSIKPLAELHRFYSAVVPVNTTNCLNQRVFAGERYQRMAKDLGGKSFDICSSGSIQAMVADVAASLQVQRQAFRTRFLMLDQRPEASTIRVVKVRTDGTRIELAQSTTSGWSYSDLYQVNIPLIDAPINMNYRSGWAVELHGDAKLIGNERAEVTFKPYGARDSL